MLLLVFFGLASGQEWPQQIGVAQLGEETSTVIRVMTFNIWLSGQEVTDGLQKIAKHIKLVDADVVALQVGAGCIRRAC